MSNDVIWSVIRGNSAFLLKKRNCPKPFSTEPLNLANKHSKRYSGLANSKAIGIAPAKTNGFVFSMKKTSSKNRPAKSISTTTMVAGPRRSLHKIKKVCFVNRYRKDLAKLAMRRASAIIRSQKPIASRKGAKKAGTSKKAE
ncbi:large ribosomal subunit protein eL28 [Lepeophtheirus salmonis]|uniref:large ribosomal subunit protein eL28 n=1 Tax=Lepeophtheirus salmonis TaxID=72036 RepID=UPI001AE254D2|nr:60S ribosomal protein L28-like [Lepeophtheirus salmonis]